MKVMLLHIGDTHIQEAGHAKDIPGIIEGVRSLGWRADAAFVVFTGDLTFSGSRAECELGVQFLGDIQESLSSETGIAVSVVAIPGNHDCDFSSSQDIRSRMIGRIRVGDVDSATRMASFAATVQAAFFDLLGPMAAGGSETVCWTRRFETKKGEVAFVCCNSAWMCLKGDSCQGRLMLASSWIPRDIKADLVIGTMHHPFNWLESNNARELIGVFDEEVDLILTGHEHQAGTYQKVSPDGLSIGYVEGGSLYPHGNGGSRMAPSFGAILVDTKSQDYLVAEFSAQGDRFEGSPTRPLPLSSRRLRRTAPWQVADPFRLDIEDPGVHIAHPRKDAIVLGDIYVPPVLKKLEYRPEAQGEQGVEIDHTSAIGEILSHETVYISGDALSGKTSLAKVLFRTALDNGSTPLLVSGRDITKATKAKLQRLVDEAISSQYVEQNRQTYLRTERGKRIVIVDDFGLCSLNPQGRSSLCSLLYESFGQIILIGDSLTQAEELIVGAAAGQKLGGFDGFEIQPYGHFLRDILIGKWLNIGQEDSIGEEEFARELQQKAAAVDAVLGRDLMPKYPIFVLGTLQQLEAGVPLTTVSGTQAYLYDFFITYALQALSLSTEDMDLIYAYLAEFAWGMHESGNSGMESSDFLKFSQGHWNDYAMPDRTQWIKSCLLGSRILQESTKGIAFKYRYVYYYFVARYMRDHAHDDDVVEDLEKQISGLHREECANVLLFLTHLRKDTRLIDRLLLETKGIFAAVQPCDMATSVQFMNRLNDQLLRFELPDGEPHSYRQLLLRNQDTIEGIRLDESDLSEDGEGEYDDGFSDLNRAVKALQVMGEIVRGSSGSLKGDVKLRLVHECFAVGLRALGALFQSVEDNLELVMEAAAEELEKHGVGKTQQDRVEVAGQFCFVLLLAITAATVERIARAVGSSRLQLTYKDLEGVWSDLATEYVQLYIHMEHEKNFPASRVFKLYEKVKDDVFACTLLRLLVTGHFVFFPTSGPVVQSVCAKIGIVPSRRALASAGRARTV